MIQKEVEYFFTFLADINFRPLNSLMCCDGNSYIGLKANIEIYKYG